MIKSALLARFKTHIANNSGSLLRAVIYTVGHFFIAAGCVWYFTGADFLLAMTDAIVEPLINGLWYFILDRFWATRLRKKRSPDTPVAAPA